MNLSPVFINGFGRSGTTLLASLLDGHPSLVVCPIEIPLMEDFYRLSNGQGHCDGEDFRKYVVTKTAFRSMGGIARTAGGNPFDLTSTDKQVFQSFLDKLAGRRVSATEAFHCLVEAFSSALHDEDVPSSKTHFVIKVNDLGSLDEYLSHFSGSKTIICVRHPMTYFESRVMYLYRAYQTNHPPHFPAIVHEDSLAFYEAGLEQVRQHMDHERCLLNKLEDMHTDLGKSMERIAAFIGITFDDVVMSSPTILNRPYEGNTVYEKKRSTNISQYTYDRKRCPFQEYVVSHRIDASPFYPIQKGGIEPSLWNSRFYRLTLEEKRHWSLASVFQPIGRGGRLSRFLSSLPAGLRPVARWAINPLLWSYRLKELLAGYLRYRRWLLTQAAGALGEV